MAVINFIRNIFPQTLAIINKSANALAVVSDKKNASSSLNYIIGGLIVVVIILVGSTVLGKKKTW